MRTLYSTWVEFTIWLAGFVAWLFFLQDQVAWWQPLVLWASFMLLFFFTRQLGYDAGAIPFVAVLILCGWVFLTRLDPTWATGQTWGVLVGVFAFLLGLFVRPTRFDYPVLWAAAALFLLGITVLFGDSVGGAKAWITVYGFRFQPVELARIFIVIYLAQHLSNERSKIELALILGIFFLILAWQRDLGPALLIYFVFCWMSLFWRFSWTKVALFSGTTVIGFVAAVWSFPHLRTRARAWLWPWDYLDSEGYQVLQGLFALRSGGVVGRGVGEGLVHVIPAGHTDYLFAIMGEEIGFLGTFSLFITYLALAFWAMRLLHRLSDRKQQLVGLGLMLLLHGQVFLVVGGILRFLPFTGMTLPLVSFGSTSLVAQLLILGMLTGLGRGGGEA